MLARAGRHRRRGGSWSLREILAEVLAVAAFVYIALLIWSRFPNEVELVERVVDATRVFELGPPGSLMAGIDAAVVLVLTAFVVGSLTLVFLAQLLAWFYSWAVALFLRRGFPATQVSDAMPPVRWFVVPLAAWGFSLACLKIFPAA
jgi:hypothetical protein